MTMPDYARPIPYSKLGDNFMRPYVHVSLEDPRTPGRKTGLVPMVIDTGSDLCIFSANLAHAIGINPLDGGDMQEVWVAGGAKISLAAWPVRIHLPQIGHHFSLSARFGQFNEGINGVLGHQGFLRWLTIRFSYSESFVIEEIRSKQVTNQLGEPMTLGGVPS